MEGSPKRKTSWNAIGPDKGDRRRILVSMQQKSEYRQAVTVRTEALARYLTEEEHLHELRHFMTRNGASVGSFAKTFALSKLQAYRKVQRLLNFNLLVIVAEQRRRGKAVKLYRCPHQVFFIPKQVIGLVEILEDPRHDAQIKSALQAALGELSIAGLMISAGAEEQLQIVLVDDDHQPVDPYTARNAALVWNSGTLMLEFEDAKSLQLELRAVMERYHARRGSGRYQYQLILTPDLSPSPEVRPDALSSELAPE